MKIMLKLAFKNLKKCLKDYVIYLLTLTIVISLFYSFLSLSSNQYKIISSEQIDLNNLYSFLKYVGFIISLILIFLIKYCNDYIIKLKSKQFAIFLILGIKRKNVELIFFMEQFFLGLLSIFLGIILGSLFSTILSNIILKFIGQTSKITINIFWDTSLYTCIFFIVIYIFIFIINHIKLKKIKILDLMKFSNKNDIQNIKSKKFYINLFFILIISIGLALIKTYKYIKVCHLSEISIESKNFLIFQIGIYIIISIFCFIYLISFLLSFIKNHNKNIVYKKTNIIFLSNLTSKIKTIPKLLGITSTLILGGLLLFSISSIMAEWANGFSKYKETYDIIISTRYNDILDYNYLPKLKGKEFINYINENKYHIKDQHTINKYFINKNDFYKRKKGLFPPFVISLSDYNYLRKMVGANKIELDNNKFAIHANKTIYNSKKVFKFEKILKLNQQIILKNSNRIDNLSLGGENLYNQYTDYIYIIPDKYIKNLSRAETSLCINTKTDLNYKFAMSLEEYIKNSMNYQNKITYNKYKTDPNFKRIYNIHIKTLSRNDSIVASLLIKLLGTYVGIILLIICYTLLSLNQLFNSTEQKKTFIILKNIGVKRTERNKLIKKQIAFMFLLPFLISIVGYFIIILLYLKNNQNQIIAYVNYVNLIHTFINIFLIGFILSLSYYILTSRIFINNVESTDNN